jgi:hypothetical protein
MAETIGATDRRALATWLLRDYSARSMWDEAGRAAWSLFYSLLPLWVGLVIFGVTWLVRDYVRLRRFVGRDKIQYETFREWLRHEPEHGFPTMAKRSLDERIVAALEWWDRVKEAQRPKP